MTGKITISKTYTQQDILKFAQFLVDYQLEADGSTKLLPTAINEAKERLEYEDFKIRPQNSVDGKEHSNGFTGTKSLIKGLSDSSSKSGLTMVYVTNGTDITMRLASFKFCFCHFETSSFYSLILSLSYKSCAAYFRDCGFCRPIRPIIFHI